MESGTIGQPEGFDFLGLFIVFNTYILVKTYTVLDVETKEALFLCAPNGVFKGMECGDILAFKL